MPKLIPVIDLFAGPGGLNEGFDSYSGYGTTFNIRLSVECDGAAHKTLRLREFFRLLARNRVPESYYEYIRGRRCREELLAEYPDEALRSSKIAWRAEIGKISLHYGF